MVVSDVIVLYVLKKRKFYKGNKYQEVDSEIEFDYEVIPSSPPEGDSEDQPTRQTALLKVTEVHVYCPVGVCARFHKDLSFV